jgi:hypothetical protein
MESSTSTRVCRLLCMDFVKLNMAAWYIPEDISPCVWNSVQYTCMHAFLVSTNSEGCFWSKELCCVHACLPNQRTTDYHFL